MRHLKMNLARLPSDFFNIVKAIQPAGTYGFGASSVSLRMVAVISSGLSGYCKYDVNHHSMVVMQSVQESHSTPEDRDSVGKYH